ncbi:MAG: serine hydrolase [Gemmatimonadales bacterium]
MPPISRSPLALALALFLAGPVIAQPAGDPVRNFDALAARAFKDWGAVGLAVAVVKDGQTVFAKGYGVRELGKPDPVDEHTLFAIGSTTKALTAAAIGMLVDEGKLAWSDPVTKWLPSFQLIDPFVTREATVADLLTHNLGLANGDVLWYETDLTPEEVLRRARFIPIAYSLRGGFIYQNIMYAAAGAVVAAASGMPWERFIKERIFRPLGMSGAVTTLAETRSKPNVASPHDVVDGQVAVIDNASVDAVAAAGSIWAGVGDMARWARFMIDSGRVDGKRLLQPGTWASLLSPQVLLPPSGFYPSAQLIKSPWNAYSRGWFMTEYGGHQLRFHTGSIAGMVAIIGIIPEARFGVYVLGNLDHVEVRHPLMLAAIDTWLGTGTRDWSADLKTIYDGIAERQATAIRRAEERRVTGTSPSRSLDAYVGSYADSLAGTVRIERRGESLRLIASSKREATLEHWHFDTFRARWERRGGGRSTVTFHLDANGEVRSLGMGGRTLGRVAGTH